MTELARTVAMYLAEKKIETRHKIDPEKVTRILRMYGWHASADDDTKLVGVMQTRVKIEGEPASFALFTQFTGDEWRATSSGARAANAWSLRMNIVNNPKPEEYNGL